MAVASIIVCGVYIFIGFFAFLVFLILENFPSALWGLATGLISLQIFHLHFLEHKQQLDLAYNDRDIGQLFIVGIICAILGGTGFLVHTSYEIATRKGISPIANNEITSIIWSFMVLKVSVVLALVARRYRRNTSTEFIVPQNVEASG
ncbi:uncharacterized protein LOC108732412 [Agrilus planipennis]|uniref:Uncharacterized protein LOC108732412 n=1 Tax=Agrilus planipennis TaxID=224129 RepID=A0A1W4WF13_AGRPL|nr:uncharacterized protein LOC108732412 [Agrilus planipennis]